MLRRRWPLELHLRGLNIPSPRIFNIVSVKAGRELVPSLVDATDHLGLIDDTLQRIN